MNQARTKWLIAMAAAAMLTSASSEVGACQPFGAVDKKDADNQLQSDQHNAGLFEWSDSLGRWILVESWYDPSAAAGIVHDGEVDVSDVFPLPNGMNSDCSGGGSGWKPPTRLDQINVTAKPSGIWPGFLRIAVRWVGGVGRWFGVGVQTSPAVISIPNEDCYPREDHEYCSMARQYFSGGAGGDSVLPPNNFYFNIVYRDGRVSQFHTQTVASHIACARIVHECR